MTAPPDRWSGRGQRPPHRLPLPDRPVGLWSARRMSRRFAGVGVQIPAARLREILAGAPAGFDESVDVNFAVAVTELRRAQRRALVGHIRRVAVRWLLVAGLVVAALNLLICVGYGFISLALHQAPM